jgi:ribosomal protein S6
MKYEFTFLLNEEKELAAIKTLFKNLDVKLLEESTWGKKNLVYPIKKATSALFYHWKIEAKRSQVAELRKKLNYNENLIRFLLLVCD